MKEKENLIIKEPLKEHKELFLIYFWASVIMLFIRFLFNGYFSTEIGPSFFMGAFISIFASFAILHGILFILIKCNKFPKEGEDKTFEI